MDKEYLEWAENEVKLAKKDPWNKDKTKELDLALSVFKQINENSSDGQDVFLRLEKLFNKIPLTCIEDSDFEFEKEDEDGEKIYECKRFSGLVKYVSKDGKTTYEDYSYDIFDKNFNEIEDCVIGLVNNILNDVKPITMPYYKPTDCVKVYIEQGMGYESDEVEGVYVDHIDFSPYGNTYKVDAYFLHTEEGWRTVFVEEYYDTVHKYYDDCDCCGCCDDEDDKEKDK